MPKGFLIDGANSGLIPISLSHRSGFDVKIELAKDSINNLAYQNAAKIFGLSFQSLKETQLSKEQSEREETPAFDQTFEDNFLEKEFVLTKLDIPEGYELDEYPESKSIAMGSQELEITFQVTESDGSFFSKVRF